jgi:hypothetical protein
VLEFENSPFSRAARTPAISAPNKAYLVLKGTFRTTCLQMDVEITKLLHDRLNARNLLRRKQRHLDDYSRLLCQSAVQATNGQGLMCQLGRPIRIRFRDKIRSFLRVK